MKNIIVAAGLIFVGLSAWANAFDLLAGRYSVVGSPRIQNDRMNYCGWYDFGHLVQLEIKTSAQGPTAILYNPHGYSSLVLNEYDLKGDFPGVGNRAHIEALKNGARRNAEDFTATQLELAMFELQKLGDGYRLNVAFHDVQKGIEQGSCVYSADLNKQ